MMSGFRSIDTPLTVEPGKTYYFEIRGLDQRYMTGLRVGARIAASLAPAEGAAAPGAIAQCCAFQPPKIGRRNNTSSTPANAGTQIS